MVPETFENVLVVPVAFVDMPMSPPTSVAFVDMPTSPAVSMDKPAGPPTSYDIADLSGIEDFPSICISLAERF